MIIGITGNSGSGKTLLSNLLKDEFNSNVIDADEVVKELSVPGNTYYNEIIKLFSRSILLENEEIDKQKLANIIFNDNNKRKLLNSITFKYVVDEIKRRVDVKKSRTTIIDAPLLIESKLNKICDKVVSVIADENIKIKRICSRDSLDKITATKRIKNQPDDIFYIKNSKLVVVNNNENNFKNQIEDIKEILKSKAIKSKDVVIIKDGNLKIMQFKKLLEYNSVLSHAFTLKPFDYGSNITYKEKEKEVNDNYEKVCKLLRIDSKKIIRPCQTHTKNIAEVKSKTGIYNEELKDIDGLVTNKKNMILSLAFADCTPLFLFDKSKNVIGNIHSGWQGTTKKIAKEAIRFMKDKFNSDPKDIIAIIGPTIRKCHFEVKEDVKDIFYKEFNYMNDINRIIKYNKKTDTYFIDTVRINKNLLKEEGILEKNIFDSKVCTVCNSNIMHSYRKEGKISGRNVTLICLK